MAWTQVSPTSGTWTNDAPGREDLRWPIAVDGYWIGAGRFILAVDGYWPTTDPARSWTAVNPTTTTWTAV